MGDTSIEWTQKTWNPVRGCTRVSEGCRHCYAEQIAARFSGSGQPYEGLAKRVQRGAGSTTEGRWTGKVRLVLEHLADPLRWKMPKRVFVNSMSDLFHEGLSNEQIAAIFGVMAAAPQHTFQVLTKRAARMRQWFEWVREHGIEQLAIEAMSQLGDSHFCNQIMAHPNWPLANVWLGVSVENQEAADERIPDLLETPAAVRWLSAEPLIGRMNPCAVPDGKTRPAEFNAKYTPLGDLNWVVAGAESGHGARLCRIEWLRLLRDLCAQAGIPFFLKQADFRSTDYMGAITIGVGSKRKAGGIVGLPYLDGRQHAAFPEVRS